MTAILLNKLFWKERVVECRGHLKAIKAFYLYEVWPGNPAYPPWLIAIPIIDFSVRGLFRKEDIPVLAAQQLALCQVYLYYTASVMSTQMHLAK